MGWLRRFVRPASMIRHVTKWRLPTLALLQLPPDRTSATIIRAAHPDWHEAVTTSSKHYTVRDPITRRSLEGRSQFARHRTRSAH
jgi:nicotinate-nucleotide adenylyltransferase